MALLVAAAVGAAAGGPPNYPNFEIARGVYMPTLLMGTGYSPPPKCGGSLDGSCNATCTACYHDFLNDTVGPNLHAWLAAGARGIDTAMVYDDQTYIREAIKSSGVPRKEIFVLTKIPGVMNYTAAMQKLQSDYEQLGSAPIDLVLSHWCVQNPQHPTPGSECTDEHIAETWKAMEDFVLAGKARALGVSNYCNVNLTQLLKTARVKPAINQIERNPAYLQPGAMKYGKEHHVHIQDYSALGNGDCQATDPADCPNLFADDTVKSVAAATNISEAQTLIQWAIQQGQSVTTRLGSPYHWGEVNPQYVKEDSDVALGKTAQIAKADLDKLNQLQQKHKIWPTGICPGEQ